jgi:hypothetical protein
LVATWLKPATVTFGRSPWPIAAGSITGGQGTTPGAASPGEPASGGPANWPPPHPMGKQIPSANVARAVHVARLAGVSNRRQNRHIDL